MKVAIVGPGSQGDVTSYDKTWEIWGINSAYRTVTANRWHRMFNLHRIAHLRRDCPQYIAWDGVFSQMNPKVPVYVVDKWGRLLANQKIFPRAELATMPRGNYHASSFDWLVAYAIHLKAEIISLHGVGFALDSPREEPISARACLEYWCGYAQGKGITVWAASDCDIFYQYHLVRSQTVYGYDDVTMVEKRK